MPINDASEFLLEDYERLLSPRTKLVAVTLTSNALGTIHADQRYHPAGAPPVPRPDRRLPGRAHRRVDVQALDCDFASLHGPQGLRAQRIGVLYGKAELLLSLPPPFEAGAT